MNLWGINVTEKTESEVQVPEDRDLLITRIALGPGAPKGVPTVVSLVNHDYDDETYILGTLRAETCEQFELDVNICSDSSVTLKVQGPGSVHFVGYYNRLASFEDSYSDYSDYGESDSDQDEDGINERVKAYMGGDSSSGEDYDDVGNVESYDSDSDLDMDEETENPSKSPVKNKQTQPIQTKPVAASKPAAQPAQQPAQQKNQQPVQAKPPQQQKPQTNTNQPAPQQQQKAPQQAQQPQADGEKKKKKKKKNKKNKNAQATGATTANAVNPEKKRKEGEQHQAGTSNNKKQKTG